MAFSLAAGRAALLFAVAAMLTAYAANGAAPDSLPDGGHGTVTAVMDGGSFRMSGVAGDVRMLGIQAAALPKGHANFKAWSEGDDAQHAFATLTQGHTVTLRFGTTPKDRNGRTLAHVIRDDGLWIDQELLREGWARVYTFPDNRQFAEELYAAEREARAAKRGVWADTFFAVRTPDPELLQRDVGTFQIVEGKVLNAAKIHGRYYLNFGNDFRTDFTATIAPEDAPLFAHAKFDPLVLKDKIIRVRGYLRNYHGPEMELTHPEQIELVL